MHEHLWTKHHSIGVQQTYLSCVSLIRKCLALYPVVCLCMWRAGARVPASCALIWLHECVHSYLTEPLHTEYVCCHTTVVFSRCLSASSIACRVMRCCKARLCWRGGAARCRPSTRKTTPSEGLSWTRGWPDRLCALGTHRTCIHNFIHFDHVFTH